MAEGVNIFDLAAKISADTKDAEQSLTNTQKKVLALASEFKKTEAAAKPALANIAKSTKEASTNVYGLESVLKNLTSTTVAMQGPLGGVAGRLGGLNTLLSSVTGEAEGAGAALGGLAGPIGIAVAGIVATTVAAAALLKQLIDLTVQTADWQGKLVDMSQQVGISVETLSALEVVAATTGGNIDSLIASLGIFQKHMEEAEDSTSKTAKVFKELGVTSLDTEQALRQTISALAKMPEGYKQTATALELFGRGGKAFLAVAKETNGDLDKLIAKLREMGIVVSKEDAKAADDFNDQLAILGFQARAAGAAVGKEMIPLLLTGLRDLSKTLKDNKEAIDALATITKVFIGLPLQAFIEGNLGAMKLLTPIVSTLADHYERIKAAIQWVAGNVPNVDPNAIPAVKSGTGAQTGGDLTLPKWKTISPYDMAGLKFLQELRTRLMEVTASTEVQKVAVKLLDDQYHGLDSTIKHDILTTARQIDVKRQSIELAKKQEDAQKTLNEFIIKQGDEILAATLHYDQWDVAVRNLARTLGNAGLTINTATKSMIDFNVMTLRSQEYLSHLDDLMVNVATDFPQLAEAAEKAFDPFKHLSDQIESVNNRLAELRAEQGVSKKIEGAIGPPPPIEEMPAYKREKFRKEILPQIQDLARQLTDSIDRAIFDGFQGGIKRGFASLLTSLLGMIRNVLLRNLETQLTQALMNVKIGGGGGGSWWSKLFGIVLGGLAGGMGGGGKGGGGHSTGNPIGHYATGLSYVPYDNFPAFLDKGERVMTAQENQSHGNVTIQVFAQDVKSFMSRDTQAQIAKAYRGVLMKPALTG